MFESDVGCQTSDFRCQMSDVWDKLVALKTQSYKYVISILIKTPENYLQCLGIKRLWNRC